MANVRDSDTSLWLHNKLGTSNDSWTGGSICTQLNAEVLRNIKDCFPDLQPQVKLKLLLSFFHIPRRNVEEWRGELEEIMEVAGMDSELWVSMLAEVMKTLPSSGSLNSPQLDEARPVFSDMVSELRRLVNRHSELAMLPLECHYLNKAALVSVVGQQPNPIKHFTLKRKPKSAALRAELLQKSSDAVSNLKKCVAPTVPIRSRGMPRKMTDTTPLKGLPSRWTIGRGGVRVAGRPVPPQQTRKDGGIKLLDIADQPATQHQKKRRRMLEMEENQKRAAAEAEALPSTAATPAGLSPSLTPAALPSPDPALPPTAPLAPSAAAARNAVPAGAASTLPEYARGLNNYVMPSTPAAPPPGSLTPNANRETGIPAQSVSAPAAVTPITPVSVQTGAVVAHPQIIKIHNADPPPLAPSPKNPLVIQTQGPGTKPIIIGQQQKLLITGQPGQKPLLVTAGPGSTFLSRSNLLKNSAGVPVILTNSVLHHAQGQTGKTMVLTSMKTGGGVQQQQTGNVIIQAQQVLTSPTTAVVRSQPTERNITTAQPPNLLPRRGLSLTREQMLEAQDMFRNANKVTRPEKALILGFMAGSRENPCPNLGNIVTIKLSENQENVLQKDNSQVTMMCETHFQMNYNNGQWMRIKKYRPVEAVTPQSGVPQLTS